MTNSRMPVSPRTFYEHGYTVFGCILWAPIVCSLAVLLTEVKPVAKTLR